MLFLLSAFAQPDLALSTRVEGAVQLSVDGAPVELAPFSKVRASDVLVLADQASLDLVYFEDGRTETFVGPLKLVVGASDADRTTQKGQALVGQALRTLPALVKRADVDKGGHTLVRGVESEGVPLDADDQAVLDEARRFAKKLRAEPNSGVLPDLYLATVFLEFEQQADAQQALARVEAACPACVPEALRAR